MSTPSERIAYSREECVEQAAEALARCYERLAGTEDTTTPAEARAV